MQLASLPSSEEGGLGMGECEGDDNTDSDSFCARNSEEVARPRRVGHHDVQTRRRARTDAGAVSGTFPEIAISTRCMAAAGP